jgi:uncharacterized cupredoxin-like copper-binding protein
VRRPVSRPGVVARAATTTPNPMTRRMSSNELACRDPSGEFISRIGTAAHMTQAVAVDLEPGTWELGCYQPGHHEAGMYRPLVVDQ